MSYSKKKCSDEEIIEACKTSETMAQAAVKTRLHYNTFVRRAKKLGVYKPNQGGKGTKKGTYSNRIPTEEILSGLHPSYQTYKLGNRIIEENVLSYECSDCKINEWNNKEIRLELDHIDGNRTNHKLENLRWLCPNCHSQTKTFRGKNKTNA
jgi:hypothetical protein